MPRRLQLSDLGPTVPRWQPSYKTNLEYLQAEVDADRSAQELRRRVGENQSTTNYYDSETYYQQQGKIFKPIITGIVGELDEMGKIKKEGLKQAIDKETEKLTDIQTKVDAIPGKIDTKLDSRLEAIELKTTEAMVKNKLASQRDFMFGLKVKKDNKYYFGITDSLRDVWGDKTNDYDIEINYKDKQIIASHNLGSISLDLTEGLMVFLTQDVVDIGDANARRDYLKLINHCIGSDLTGMRLPANVKRAEFISFKDEWDLKMDKTTKQPVVENPKSRKFRDLIWKNTTAAGIKTGEGLRVIVIPPYAEDRIKRLTVLLGSNNAGNNVGYGEFTAILDTLLKDKKIDRKMYKHLLYKWNESETERYDSD